MDEVALRKLMAGETRGVAASLARLGLSGLSLGYGVGVRLRNLAFDLRWRKVYQAPVPVVSLGNLTTGGTGKTPLAAYLARWFRDRSVRVAFVSRGYRAEPGAVNDEALVLDQLCPDVPHLQDADRVAAARIAVDELASQLLILDDAFQHRRLARDLDIVLIDALNPWGYGRLLPRGLLREPLRALRRADLVILTRVDQCDLESRQKILARIDRIRGKTRCVEVAFPPQQLRNAAGETAEWSAVRQRPLAAFCGIGNPASFRRMLGRLGLSVADDAFREYPDHHAYTREDVESLKRWAQQSGAAAVLTTQKDFVKLSLVDFDGIPLWGVEIGVEVLAHADELEQQLSRVLAKVERDEFGDMNESDA